MIHWRLVQVRQWKAQTLLLWVILPKRILKILSLLVKIQNPVKSINLMVNNLLQLVLKLNQWEQVLLQWVPMLPQRMGMMV